MKKILFLIFTFLICTGSALATNHIYDIDMEIYVDKNGTAYITETWSVAGSDGSEWYKVYNNLGSSELTNFKVYMDGKLLTYKNWDVSESLNQKKGYYGINYTSQGLELCFGKYDYNYHEFKLTYNISNFVINTDDSQVIYWNLIDKLSSVEFDDFSIVLSSYYEFPDTLDVWGYGYKGLAYVHEGKIYLSNEDDMNDKYAVLLAKFPLNTFVTNNFKEGYNTFEDVYNAAENGSYKYNYNEGNILISIIIVCAFLGTFIGTIIAAIFYIRGNMYGYKDNKVINKKNTNLFRDIPCNKDIYYANALIGLNKWSKSSTNILGAILLKWIKTDKIKIQKDKDLKIIFNSSISLDNKEEQELYDMMYKASGDGILEAKELERWAKNNYNTYFNLFDKIKNNKIKDLRSQGHIYDRKNKKECKYKNVLDDTLYEESKKLYGLKLFLEEFSSINTKEVIEVKLWDEYLMFAHLFGIADKVAIQFKHMYPEYIENVDNNFDFDTIIFLNTISINSVSAASSARSRAESYSSGGGGFSSGGGGGGSFGGGGGGSR